MKKQIVIMFVMIILFSMSIFGGAPVKLPVVYSGHYDITLYGIEKLHPFDTSKYSKVYDYLISNGLLTDSNYYKPALATNVELLTVHSISYLKSLNKSREIAKIAELPALFFVPNPVLQERLLKPMKYAVGGTILGAKLALKHGWAINLSGGYHHAKADKGEGFCYYADVAIAIKDLWKENEKIKVLIIDLDAHQGNGNESIFKGEKRVDIFDVYNSKAYPDDEKAKKAITYNFPVNPLTEDDDYMLLIDNQLPAAIKASTPDLIIYNAGTDVLTEDHVGGLSLTEEGIIKRDELVFKLAMQNKTPILMVLSGGYTPRSAGVIGKSVENLLANVVKVKD